MSVSRLYNAISVRKPTDVMVSSYDYEFDVPMVLVMDTDDFVVEEANADEVRNCPLKVIITMMNPMNPISCMVYPSAVLDLETDTLKYNLVEG